MSSQPWRLYHGKSFLFFSNLLCLLKRKRKRRRSVLPNCPAWQQYHQSKLGFPHSQTSRSRSYSFTFTLTDGSMGWHTSQSGGVNILVGDIIIRDELRRRFQGTPKSHTETQTKHKQWQHLQWSQEIIMIIECNSFCKTKTQCASTHHLCTYLYTCWHAHKQLSQEWFA